MISKLLKTFSRGLTVLRGNTRLLFVALLIFVFPLLFVFTVQNFFDTAYTNIQTSEKRRVGMLQDALTLLIQTQTPTPTPTSIESLHAFSEEQQKQNPDITEIKIVQKITNGYLIRDSLEKNNIGTLDQDVVLYQSSAVSGQSLIFEYSEAGERKWRVVRSVTGLDSTLYFVVTVHTFKTIDSIMAARRQEAYFGLTSIFIFLFALAYWFSRQIDWQRKYSLVQAKMEERDLFINMIAHEFRTPLTAINGYNSFLAESTNLSLNEKGYVGIIQTSADRLLALVNDFLEVARIQSGKMELEKIPTDVQTIITGVVEVLKPMAAEKGLMLFYKPLAVPVMYTTDSKRLHQVLQNIVSNSLKYTDKGSVEITTEITPMTVTIRVKDTGMGITADDQQKLFAPFSRVGGVEKTSTTGTGLGMWITKQLIELLGGTISVESIKGVGTHVVIVLKR